MGFEDEQFKVMLLKDLEDTECVPFWKLETLEDKKISMRDKLAVKNEEIGGQLWRNLIIELALCWECHKEGLISIATQKLLDCHTWIKNSEDGNFINKYSSSFTHVVLSYKAFLSMENGAYSEAKRYLSQIVHKSKMNNVELAAVCGIKSNIFAEYGIKGNALAFIWAREALKLNVAEPEWHFLLGKLHTRLRNFSIDQKHVDEELKSFERAYEELKSPHTAVYLAGCILARSRTLFIRQPLVEGERVKEQGVELELKRMNTRAMQLFWEALKSNKNQCLHIMARVAFGLISLPADYSNANVAMGMAFKVLEKSPSNIMAHAVLSKTYANNNNLPMAICHAAVSAKLGSYVSHLRLLNYYAKLKRDDKDFVSLFDELLVGFPHDVYRLQTYVVASNFYLFRSKDLFRSLPYFENAMEIDPQLNVLHDLYIWWVKVYLNLYELMYNEIECALTKESYINEKEKTDLLRVQDKIIAAWPPIRNYQVKNNLLDKLFHDRTPCGRGRPTRRRNGGKTTGAKKSVKDVNNKKKDKSKQVKSERKSVEPKKVRQSGNQKWKNLFEGANVYFGTNTSYKSKTRANLGTGTKRARSDSQNQSCKKVMDKLKNLSSVSIDQIGLRPDTKPMMTPSGGVANVGRSLSQLSLDSLSPKFRDKRSVSNSQRNPFRKKPNFDGTAEYRFVPNSPMMGAISKTGQLTVQNLERHRKNLGAPSRESLDSDDTLGSRLSNLSLRRELSTERSLTSYCSSVPQRSSSLDVSRPVGSISRERHLPDFPLTGDRRLSSRSPQQFSRGWYDDRQPDLLTQKMRELSLEKKRDMNFRPVHASKFSDVAREKPMLDWRSPLGRQKNSERVLKPPGRSPSATSQSSVDSDYVGSRWTKGGYSRRH